VLLVLLIIFMVVAPSRPGHFETKIPARPNPDAPNIPNAEMLVVTMGLDHGISLNGVSLTLDGLGPRLSSVLADRVDRTVIVRAPRGLPYRDVVTLVDEIKESGAGTIGLQVDFLDT